MSYAIWNQFTYYAVGDQVVLNSVLYLCILAVGPTATTPLTDTTHWTNLGSVLGITLPSGNYTCVAGLTQVIAIPSLTTNSIVNLTYVHPPNGGQQQYFANVVPTAGTLTITLGAPATTAEFILWSVAKP